MTSYITIQFELSQELKKKVQDIFFDHKYLNVYVRNAPGKTKAVRSKVDVSSMRATLEQFDKKVDGIIDPQTKLLCVYSIRYHLRKYIKFDYREQLWYSENFPNDPSKPKDLMCKDRGNDNKTKAEQDSNKQKAKLTTFKYSCDGKKELFESIILQGKPCFITYNHKTKKIESTVFLDETFGILSPPKHNEISYMPYEFETLEQVQDIVDSIVKSNIDLDKLYSMAKDIICKYNDQNDYKLTLVASSVIWSYFQDRFSTTRYDMFVGGVGGGKSSLADTFGAIGYRPVNLTDPSAPNLFRTLGSVEAGQCTIIMEEAEKIDQFYEIMAILKTGYSRDKKVSKINNLTMTPEFFYTYCFKIIVAERSPGQSVARGLDRSLIFNCYKGVPKHDIKEIMNPTNTGGVENNRLLNELKAFRNTLLIYRLIHFKDDIPDIDIGIIGRDKELIKPTLQLFQDTKSNSLLIAAFQTVLDLKNQRRGASLETQLLLTLRNVVGKQQHLPEFRQREIPFKVYWNRLKDDLGASIDEKKQGEMHTAEYGTLYGSTTGSALHDKFGVESKHTRDGNLLVIDYDILEKLEKIYETKIIIKKKSDDLIKSGYNVKGGEGGEHGEGNWKKGYDGNSEKISKAKHEKQDSSDLEQKNISKEHDPLFISPSLPSPLHLLDTTREHLEYKAKLNETQLETSKFTYGCYACREFELTDNREAYKKHCDQTHPDGKLTTRLIPLRSFGNGEGKLIRFPCPFCEFVAVTPIIMKDHIEENHPECIHSK